MEAQVKKLSDLFDNAVMRAISASFSILIGHWGSLGTSVGVSTFANLI